MHFCPQCHAMMEAGEADGIRFLGCRSCGGIWLEGEIFEAAKSRPGFIAKLNEILPVSDHPASSSGMLRSCIECIATTLQPLPESPGLLSCPGCGCVWLAGEQRSAAGPAEQPPAPSVSLPEPDTSQSTATPPATQQPEATFDARI